MRYVFFVSAWLLATYGLTGCGTTGEAILRDVNQAVGVYGTPSEQEVALGLKQALETGLRKGADALPKENGFLGDPAIKILFPEEARKDEETLSILGFDKQSVNPLQSRNKN